MLDLAKVEKWVQSPSGAPYGGCSTMEERKVVALETADRNRSVTPNKKESR